MAEEEEILWEYDKVEIGQASPPFTIEVTEELIARYVAAVRNPNPAYQVSAGHSAEGGGTLAMPTMIIRVAPGSRTDIAANNGFVALESARDNPRQTPFAKCEVRWFAPLRAGDTITSFAHVVDKYERRGNKFVTYRTEATNQRGVKVAEHDYTTIFEYAKGQHTREESAGVAGQAVGATSTEGSHKAVNTEPLTFNSIDVGDELPPFTIGETQETINASGINIKQREPRPNLHTDEEFAKRSLFGGTANSGATTMAYVTQMLEARFPASAFYNGGRLLHKAIRPFRPGDIVTFTGRLTGKREEDSRKIVDCEVKAHNQLGQLIGVSEATLILDE